jgi:3-oxoacyl-[acyl-carrier protein] reductase
VGNAGWSALTLLEGRKMSMHTSLGQEVTSPCAVGALAPAGLMGGRGGRLAGKVALVSAGGQGIGQAVAEKMAADGARVVVQDMDAELAEKAVAAIQGDGGEAVACAGRITAPGFAGRLIATAVEAYGGLDIIVNNAEYAADSSAGGASSEHQDRIADAHLIAPFRILRAAAPVISAAARAERAAGLASCRKIVNVSSIAGPSDNAGPVSYAAARAGLLGLTATLAREWGPFNVTVNAVACGVIQAEKAQLAPGRTIPLGRTGTLRDAAGAVYLLCLPESDYISGQTIVCGGGLEL